MVDSIRKWMAITWVVITHILLALSESWKGIAVILAIGILIGWLLFR